MKFAVISYWVGEYEPAKTWLYNSEKEASEAMQKMKTLKNLSALMMKLPLKSLGAMD